MIVSFDVVVICDVLISRLFEMFIIVCMWGVSVWFLVSLGMGW